MSEKINAACSQSCEEDKGKDLVEVGDRTAVVGCCEDTGGWGHSCVYWS